MLNNDKADLVLGSDGSLYHINLLPGDVAETIILVGDPGRTEMVARFFDHIELRKQNREIVTITGIYKGKRISVMSSGMGTDNIEIVVNELDALFNINLATGLPKDELISLNLIRIGTSGALQRDIPVVNSFLVSEYGIGLDGLCYFYNNSESVINGEMTKEFINYMNMSQKLPGAYAISGSQELLSKVGAGWPKGITLTAPGFYAPQGRKLRLDVHDTHFIDKASKFTFGENRITNFEMETSALYVLSAMLGHKAITVCNIIANRVTGKFDPDYKKSMTNLVGEVLDRLT
jgi:uridine phosphorylase